MRSTTVIIVVYFCGMLVCGSICGCSGGKIPYISDIQGPPSVGMHSVAEYSVELVEGTNATFQWSVEPPAAGEFENPTSAKTIFTPSNVEQDTPVKISILVTTDQYGPVHITKEVMILLRSGWSRSWGGTGVDENTEITVDNSGNVYIAGMFSSTVDFDPGPGLDRHTSNGYNDIFFSKFDSNGGFLWANTLAGDYLDHLDGVTVDTDGNIYILGRYGSDIDFDPGPGIEMPPQDKVPGIFLGKYDPSGGMLWVRVWSAAWICSGYSVAVDNYGAVYVTGYFQDAIDLNPGPEIDLHISNGHSDAYLSKFDSNGEFQWALSWGGERSDNGIALAVDNNGGVCVGGNFSTTVDFDPGAGIANLTATDYSDIFLLKLDASGGFLWARAWGGEGYDHCTGIDIDSADNICVTGNLDVRSYYITCGHNPPHGPNGDSIVFLRKYNPSGDLDWERIWGGEYFDYSNEICVDGDGYIYVGGFFESSFDFDPGQGIDVHTADGYKDIFLSKFDPNGDFIWAITPGGIGGDYGDAVAVDNSGYVYISGHFSDTINLYPGYDDATHTSNGEYDIFLVKLNSSGYW